MSYVAVMFDRWESLRVALASGESFDCVSSGSAEGMTAPFSYREFLVTALSDDWNESLYRRIIVSEHSDKCSIQPLGNKFGTPGESGVETRPKVGQTARRRIIRALDRLLGKLSSEYDVVFLNSTFRLPALLRLNLALGQVPRLFLAEFGLDLREEDLPEASASNFDRKRISSSFQPGSRFEEFLKCWLVRDLPKSVVEYYSAMRERVRANNIRTKAIVTGGSHWTDALAKMWFAEQVEEGVKVVIVEHGGSLPSFKEFFDFESEIADVKTSWFLPYHPKHKRLPPPRLVERFERSPLSLTVPGRKYCSVLANECPRWVHRLHYYPMSGQWRTSFDMVLELHELLNDRIKECFRVRPYPSDQGWNTRARFSAALGLAKMCTEEAVDQVFPISRVVVCTYPETTFAEAMASETPTILMYPDHLYELNQIALPLLEALESAKIVFHDAKSAARHINSIWRDVDGWWGSEGVRRARGQFREQALDLDVDWLRKWTAFLKGVVK